MDHFQLHKVFGLHTTFELFSVAAELAHYTSVIRCPVTKGGKNYSGDKRLLQRPMLRSIVDEHLPAELKLFPEASIVPFPFGPNARRVIRIHDGARSVDPNRVLGGILHPGGQQWNRYNVQLESVSAPEA